MSISSRPQSWEADLEATRNLGRYGTTTLRLYGRLYEDVVDIIPIGADRRVASAISTARHAYGVEWKTTFNFDPLGWKGAKLDARVQVQETRVEDPLTGETRPICNSLLHLLRHHSAPRHPGQRLGLWDGTSTTSSTR